MNTCHRYSGAEIDFLRAHVIDHTYEELAVMLNAHFNLSVTHRGVRKVLNTRGINRGGKREAQKGKKNRNYKPIGTEKVDSMGYIKIKVKDAEIPTGHDAWKSKHALIWEFAYGPIPDNHVVVFKDGDKRNFDIDNLLLLTKQEQIYLSTRKMITTDDDIMAINRLIANIQLIANKRAREMGAAQNGSGSNSIQNQFI
jgi:hypothetical protein